VPVLAFWDEYSARIARTEQSVRVIQLDEAVVELKQVFAFLGDVKLLEEEQRSG